MFILNSLIKTILYGNNFNAYSGKNIHLQIIRQNWPLLLRCCLVKVTEWIIKYELLDFGSVMEK